ncbi:glycosyltransferase [Pseudomonadota bacterium 24LQ007]
MPEARPTRLPDFGLPIKFIDSEVALSRPEAANLALSSSDTPYALFLDDDDTLAPTHLESLLEALLSTPDSPAAYSWVQLEHLHPGSGQLLTRPLTQEWRPGLLLTRNFLPIHSVLFDLKTVKEHGMRFDTCLPILEDWDFWLQLAQQGDFVPTRQITATYRIHLGRSDLSHDRDATAYANARVQLLEKWASRLTPAQVTQGLEAAARENELSEARTNDLREAVVERIEENKRLLTELNGLREAVVERIEENKRLLTELSAQADQIQTLNEQKERLLNEKQQYAQSLEAIRNSTSFRMTAPLRKLVDAIRAYRTQLATPHPVAKPRNSAPAGPIDIIVPVYKGLEETRACIESVLHSSCKTPYRLVVINDCSPEPELTAWLRESAASGRYTLLENEENLGFVKTVNRGMRLSDKADVVLLNSDAEVARDWLDRLVYAAYEATPYPVSSVTPCSNNATICSYPRFCQDNEIPAGYSLETLDALFAATNPQQVIEIPTAVGFCMYIRRDSLQQVGLFDEEHFGKGYGEENDFCMRASKSGWRHLQAMDTFVWHKGSVSFGSHNQPIHVARAIQVMDRLHPEYQSIVHSFIQQDPGRAARIAVDIERVRASGLPTVLIILHQRGGGTERHCRDLIKHHPECDWLTLTPDTDGHVLLSNSLANGCIELRYHLMNERDALIQMLKALGVMRLHWHHWLGFDPSILTLADDLGVPQDVTLHDYYSICPQISLTNSIRGYCGEQGLDQCRACLRGTPAPGNVSIEQWREQHRLWLKRCERVIAPSKDTAARIQQYYPELDVIAAYHPDSVSPEVNWTPPTEGEPLRVAVIGALSALKGADILEQTAKLAEKQQLPLSFRLFGYAYRTLAKSPNLSVTGPYQEEQLNDMLRDWQPHIAWFPSQCPETYSYTLSACLKLGLPVVCSDLGALPERIQNRPYSWTMPYDTSPEDWCQWLARLPSQLPGSPETSFDTRLTSTTANGNFYNRDYAQTLRIAQTRPSAPLPTEWRQQLLEPFNQKTPYRHRLLALLYYLRGCRSLSLVSRSIPPSWQRKAKSLLLGEHH